MIPCPRLVPFLLAAAALAAAGCRTETRTVGRDPYAAAEKAGWRSLGQDGSPDSASAPESADSPYAPRRRPADEVTEVPVEAFLPVSRFLDGEGYFLGDRVEIDCSFEPFMARFVPLMAGTGDGKYVVQVNTMDEVNRIRTVELRSAAGPTHMEAYTPRVSFASPRLESEVRPDLRPPFQFLGTEHIIVRFHLRQHPDHPVFFHARAEGTAPATDPDGPPRDCMFKYIRPGGSRVTEGPRLFLGMELLRAEDGRWRPVIREPDGRNPPATGSGAGVR